MALISAAAIVTGDRVARPGWLHTAGRRIADCGAGAPPGPADVALPAATVVPGFVDMHAHGGGGVSYADADPAAAVAAHRAHGTTGGLASLVTAAPAALLAQVRALAPACAAGVFDGIHLEGPWLSGRHCGAHDPALLRDPDPAEVDALLAAGAGTIAMVTLAPERPGALAAIGRLTAAGVTVAIGHTDADFDLTRAAIDAGATVATHLFNAMAPLHHRAPGPVPALLADPRVTLELIADGVHVHPALIAQVIATAGADRVALVTDAMAAAAAGDGDYRLGGLDVRVADGVARLAGTDTIAGSTATMDALFRAVVPDPGDDAALLAAARLTAATPARAIGLGRAGALSPGRDADLVVLDAGLRVQAVMRAGVWLGG